MKELPWVLLLALAAASAQAGQDCEPSPAATPAAPTPAPLSATIGGPLPPPLPLFPPTNWWNLDITNAPLDGNSANFIGFIGASQPLHPDFGGEVSPGSIQIYGFPYIVTDAAEPRVAVSFLYSDQSDGVNHNTNTSFPFYPVPPEAITQPHWIEEGDPGDVDLRASNDRHVLIVDATHNFLYELYNVFFDGTTWQGGSGAFFDMNTNHRRPDTWTSADAGGLAILPGLVRYDEAYLSSDPIRHAFRVTLRDSLGHFYPASHEACNACSPQALPMGARLRLKASFDISGFDPNVQKIFQAMKTYGLIMADNGTDMYVSGTFDTRWNNDILNPAFGALTAGDFDVIQLGYCDHPAAAASGSATICSGASALLSGSGGVGCSWAPAAGLSDPNSCAPLASPASTTTYTLIVTDDAGCASVNAPAATVTVSGTGAPPVPVISAPLSVPPGAAAVNASIANPGASPYAWTVTGGTLTGGQGTPQITFDAGTAGTTVTLEAVETGATCDSSPGLRNVQVDFLDVPPSNPFHDFVDAIARNGVTAGCGGGNYCPANSVLRSQMAVFLLRGEHGAGYAPPPAVGNFADVLPTNPFAPWIEQLNFEGITAGCDAVNYCPGSAVSRAGMAVFLLVAEHGSGYTPPAATGIFADVPPTNPFAPWIEQLYNEGITGGCNATPLMYCPANSVTRAQMAVFLTATFNLP